MNLIKMHWNFSVNNMELIIDKENEMTVQFHDLNDEKKQLKFVVIHARYQGKWIFVRHKDRTTWEIPGGHIEPNESIDDAAKRELWEESGALEFELIPICNYSVCRDEIKSYGRLYFAEVEKLGNLLEHEIVEIMLNDELPINLTYANIQPYLYRRVLQQIQS